VSLVLEGARPSAKPTWIPKLLIEKISVLLGVVDQASLPLFDF